MISASSGKTLTLTAGLSWLLARLKAYWKMIKDLQTGLLLFTALAGYATGCCTNPQAGSIASMLGSLFLAVSGCTVLNMVVDRDIDGCMMRTSSRPLPAGTVTAVEALVLGLALTLSGIFWGLAIYQPYGLLVLLGALCNSFVCTLWLKRRTPYAILFGGIAGGIPILAGRTLAIGHVDLVGMLFLGAILLWIPNHIMTFTIKYQEQYKQAGIPTFAESYGPTVTRVIIAVTSIALLLLLHQAASLLRLHQPLQTILLLSGILIAGLNILAIFRQHKVLNFALYKGASVYMLTAMLIFLSGGL